MVVDGTLQTSGKFGTVELYYHGIEGSANTPGKLRTITSSNGGPVIINMDGNPTAGVYVARRNHNSYDGHDIPNPVLKFNSGLEISGDLNNKYITKSGQAVSGITIANGSMEINGNLSINLTNMNSSSEVDFSNVVPSIEDLPNTPDWDIVYGWSSLDQANNNSSEQPHDINLLQAGIATGFSQLNVNGNASITVSGTNGLLAGWYWAPNFRTQYSGIDFDQIDARDPTTIAGDLNITVSQQGSGYGVFGTLWDSDLSSSSKEFPRAEAHIDGKISIDVTATNFTVLNSPENSYKLSEDEDYIDRIVGLYANKDVQIKASDGIQATVKVLGQSEVSDVYGVYLWNKSKIETPEIIADITIDDNARVDTATGLSISNLTDVLLTVDNVKVNINGNANERYGIDLFDSTFIINKNLAINAGSYTKEQKRPTALFVFDMSEHANFIVNQQDKGQVSIIGDIDAISRGNTNVANINFGNNGSFTGAANVEIAKIGSTCWTDEEFKAYYQRYGLSRIPDLTLNFSSKGSWQVNGNSAVTKLILGNGSLVDLGLYDYTQNTTADALGFGSSTLDIRKFESSRSAPGIFQFHLNDQQATQQSGLVSLVYEVDQTNNYAEVRLTDDGSGFSAAKTNYLIQDSSLDRNAEFALVDQPGIGRKAQLGVYLYELKSFVDETGELADKYSGSAGDIYWYAEKTDKVAPPIEDTVSMASYSTQIAHYLARLSDLRQRLGDVRYYGSNGLWTTVKTSNEHLTGLASSSFEIDTYGINVGWDGTDQNGWTYGLYGRYFTSDQKAKQPYHYTNGESESWGLSLYLSRAFENNAYIDLVASYDHFDQELNGQLSDGVTRFKADYDTHGYGVSAEAGFQHALTDDGLCVLEPSVQLSYYRVEGQDFKLTKGISVSESSVDSLTGRAGVNLVRKFMRNGEKVGELYAKAGVNYEFMGEQSISANEAKFEGDLLGLRWYYGLGMTMKIRPDLYGWLQIAREEGDDYTKEYEGTAGIRWVF